MPGAFGAEGLAAASLLVDPQIHNYENTLYVLFTAEPCNDHEMEQLLSKRVQSQPSLVEHHLSVMLSSDLPDIKNLKHIIADSRNGDLSDILNAIEHLVEIHQANLPTNRQFKDVNWKAKLIIAELRDWAKDLTRENALAGFCEMLKATKARAIEKEQMEVQAMTSLSQELIYLSHKV